MSIHFKGEVLTSTANGPIKSDTATKLVVRFPRNK